MTSLFANQPEERADALDQRITSLLYGNGAGLFSQELNASERAVLKALRYHTSSSNPIMIRTLSEKTDLNERDVKDIIRRLRLGFGLPIGANRSGERGGYYFILTDQDRRLFKAQFMGQIKAELEVMRVVCGAEETREMLGQLTLEVK